MQRPDLDGSTGLTNGACGRVKAERGAGNVGFNRNAASGGQRETVCRFPAYRGIDDDIAGFGSDRSYVCDYDVAVNQVRLDVSPIDSRWCVCWSEAKRARV